MTVNEKRFIEDALQKELRANSRRLFEYRQLAIKFGKEDGSTEVHLGQTDVMGYVTAQLVQPYCDQPNEGTLSFFVELSPMADPSSEVGRPGESAIELGRVIDRGLRESRAIDSCHCWEACMGPFNLVDAANIAALAALKSFRRLDCSVAGDYYTSSGGQRTITTRNSSSSHCRNLHIFYEGNAMIIDPSYTEEAVMGGRMIVTMNASRELCDVQKAGKVGVTSNIIRQCLDLAGNKAAVITKKI